MTDYAPALTAVLDTEPEPSAGVVTRAVDYDVDGTACRGFLATPAGDGPFPGVLVVHDWQGVRDVIEMRCEMLARLGYAAFAADVYGADVRPTPQEAPGVAGRYYADPPLWRERVSGGFAAMLGEEVVDPERTAAIGYCFGGSSVLQLARTGAPVGGVVSFHGGLSTGPAGEARDITAKLLVLTGAADPVVPDADVQAFEDELRTAPLLDWQLVAYAGAMHAFAVPDADAPDHGAQYHPVADRRSWAAMKAFLQEVLAPR